MCFEPVTMAIAGTALASAGSLFAGYQGMQAGNYSATVAKNNATAAEQKAGFEAGLIRERGDDTVSAGVAALGKSGVDPGASGSAAAVIGKSAENAEMDALAALYSGRIDANAQRAAAKLYKSQGRQAMVAGVINAGSTLLTGLSRPGGGSTYGQGGLYQGTGALY